MRSASVFAALTAALTLGGCQLYFGGDDEPPPNCGGGWGTGGAEDAGYPSDLRRNPQTGDCEEFGGYGGGGGYGGNCYWDDTYQSCVCDDYVEPTSPPVPNWPACDSSCTLLDEETCLAEPGCQVAYWEQSTPHPPLFRGCYATFNGGAPSSCFNLDAIGCAQHDNCAIFYEETYGDAGGELGQFHNFTQCRPEPTTSGCAAVDCGPGYHCDDTCYPGAGCTPFCVPDVTGCAAIDCGPGYECVETCETLDPSTAGPFPGQCEGTCVALAACETLATQNACDARSDCTSVFNGDDCTCYPGGYCECQILTWDHCESVGAVPMPL